MVVGGERSKNPRIPPHTPRLLGAGEGSQRGGGGGGRGASLGREADQRGFNGGQQKPAGGGAQRGISKFPWARTPSILLVPSRSVRPLPPPRPQPQPGLTCQMTKKMREAHSTRVSM